MEKVANMLQENTERIRTWQGTVRYDRKEPKGDWIDNMVIDFYVDRVCDRRLVVTKHTDTKIKGQSKPLDIVGILLVGDLYYEYRGINPDGLIPIPQGNTGVKFTLLKDVGDDFQESYLRGNLRVSPRSGFAFSEGNLKDNFDPFYVITHRSNEASLSYMHDLVATVKKNVVYKSEILIKSEENLVEISWKLPNDKKPCRYIYDLSKGGNCAFEEIPDNYSADPALRTIEYTNLAGIFVPQKIDYKLRDKIHETIEFIEQKINEPIDDSIFSPVNLGVKRGDGCYDERTKERSTIRDSSFPQRDVALLILQRPWHRVLRTVLLIIGILMISIALGYKYREWRTNRPNRQEGTQ
ncbi:MAG: hypothetical protein ACRC2T_16440 [Thermoguttaceae bacterium]